MILCSSGPCLGPRMRSIWLALVLSVAAEVRSSDGRGHTALVRKQAKWKHDAQLSLETSEHEEDELGEHETQIYTQRGDARRSTCDRRRRDLCSCQEATCCDIGRCHPSMFVGGPLKMQQMSNGCGKYLAAKATCQKNGTSWDMLEVLAFDTWSEPPSHAQWRIIDVDGNGTHFKIANIARQAACGGSSFLREGASAWGGDLKLEAAAEATVFEIKIHERTSYHEIKIADVMPYQSQHAYLNNPADCFNGASPTLGQTPDLWRLVPANSVGSHISAPDQQQVT